MLTAKKMTTLALPKWWYPKFLSISLAIIIFMQLPYFNIAVYWDSWANRNLSPQFFTHEPALIYVQRLRQPCVQIPMDFRSIWTQLAQLKNSKSSCPCCQGAVELAIFTSGFTQRSNIFEVGQNCQKQMQHEMQTKPLVKWCRRNATEMHNSTELDRRDKQEWRIWILPRPASCAESKGTATNLQLDVFTCQYVLDAGVLGKVPRKQLPRTLPPIQLQARAPLFASPDAEVSHN